MAASNSTIRSETLSQTATLGRNSVSLYADLFKARLTLLVLLTTSVGYYVGQEGSLDLPLMFHAIFGTALVASGGAALNQYLERIHDGRMRRTQDRPLPSGQMSPTKALSVGSIISVLGVLYLGLLTNWTSALVALASWVLYVAVYTPLKRRTWLNTAIGAVPGGLPPLIGWTAARGGNIDQEGLSLFLILAFWQLPHFFAIAWMYREEYAQAGYKMLPAVDPTGRRTSRQTVLSSIGLFALSLCPFLLGMTGGIYLAGALLLGGAFLWISLRFRRTLSLSDARLLFFASIIYLPLLLGIMVWDKV